MNHAQAQTPLVVSPMEGSTFWLTGERLTLLASGQQTKDAYAAFEIYVAPGGGPPPHIHQRETVIYFVLEGHLSFRCGTRACPATPGTLIHLPKGMVQSFKNDRSTPARLFGSPIMSTSSLHLRSTTHRVRMLADRALCGLLSPGSDQEYQVRSQ